MTLFHRILVLSILMISSVSAFAEEKRDLGYALFLFGKGFYAESRAEFLFQSYASEDRIVREKSLLWASKAMLESGNASGAEAELQRMASSGSLDLSVREKARFEFLRSLYVQKKFYRLDGECLDHPEGGIDENLVHFWSLVSTGQWNRAQALADAIDEQLAKEQPANTDAAERFRAAADLVRQRPEFNTVSPAFTAGLSALFPGAGHAYAGNWTSAFGSFFLNAVFISLTAYSAVKGNYVAAGVCGFLEIGWYSGNIVSAYQTAEFRNRAQQQKYIKKISEQYPFGIGYSYPF